MTETLDIQIVQGQRWTKLFEVADLVTENSGLRLHIRDHHGATLLRAALTHDGATNARVSFTEGGILANLGATITTGWDLGESATRRWVYSVERYSLTDADDVTVTHKGTAVIIANPTDENSVDEVAPFPSFNLFALRFDIEQVLTEEQRLRVLTTLGITPGGSPTVVHADTTGRDAADAHPMAAVTGLVSALAGKETAGAVATHNADTGAHGQTATGRALVTAVSAAAARTAISLGNVDNTSDANKPISTATQTALDAKQSTSEKGSANGYASLDSGGKIPQAQLPAIAITEYLGSVANQAAMLALSGQKGDWCIRSDTGAVWIISGTDPALLGSWTAMSYPASPVTSVAGRTGDVTISSEDVSGLGTAATTDATAYATAAQGATADSAVQPARSVATQHSITGGGDLSADRTLALVNDTASPGNNKVYGTDGSGARGWKDDPAGGGAGTKTLAVFAPGHNQPPASAYATFDTRNSALVLDFDDATDESAVFVGVIPEGAVLTSGIIASVRWMATTATSGNVRWRVAFERGNTDLDSDSFDTATEATGATNGTSGIATTTEIAATNIDSLVAGDTFRVRITRVGTDGTNDNMSGDAELRGLELRAV